MPAGTGTIVSPPPSGGLAVPFVSEAATAANAFPAFYSPSGINRELADKIFEYLDCSKHVRAVEVFYTVDTDGSGELDSEEWIEALRMMRLDLTDMQARSVFKLLDDDNSGTIHIEEFMIHMLQAKKWRKRSNTRQLQARHGPDNESGKRRKKLHRQLQKWAFNPGSFLSILLHLLPVMLPRLI